MALYRASPKDGIAWVTGASSGIGRRLAIDLARDGYTVAATSRDEAKLLEVVTEASGLAGRVVPFTCDLTDEDATARTVEAIEREVGPIALAVLNAGTSFPTHGERLEAGTFTRLFKTNVLGTAFSLVPVVDRMKARGRGHVALVGSLTGYFALPTTAAYGGTKAALNLMAEALKYDFDKMNIRIQMVNPGFVDTPLTKKNRFPMPFLVTPEDASKRILGGLARGGFEVTFPKRLAWPMKLIRILPMPVRFWLIDRFTGWSKRPLGGPSNTRP